LFGQPSFEKRPRIHAGASVALEVNDVAGVFVGAAAEEVVEADFIKRGGRGVSRDVAADVGGLVRPLDHRHRVPADDVLDPPLQHPVTGERGLFLRRNCVDVGGGDARGDGDAVVLGLFGEGVQKVLRPAPAPGVG